MVHLNTLYTQRFVGILCNNFDLCITINNAHEIFRWLKNIVILSSVCYIWCDLLDHIRLNHSDTIDAIKSQCDSYISLHQYQPLQIYNISTKQCLTCKTTRFHIIYNVLKIIITTLSTNAYVNTAEK